MCVHTLERKLNSYASAQTMDCKRDGLHNVNIKSDAWPLCRRDTYGIFVPCGAALWRLMKMYILTVVTRRRRRLETIMNERTIKTKLALADIYI